MSKTIKHLNDLMYLDQTLAQVSALKSSDILKTCSHHGPGTYPALALRRNLIVSFKNGLEGLHVTTFIQYL